MSIRKDLDTSQLLHLASQGDSRARQDLLRRHEKQLREMVRLRMDRRLAARADPSDVVQEALADAAQGLSDYLRRRPLPFYAWLRQLAWDRLIELHRRHLHAQKRSVKREEPGFLDLPEDSAVMLAGRLIAAQENPSQQLLRKELRARVRRAIDQLPPRDREILILRHLEQLSTSQTAAVLGLSEAGVKSRHLRGLERLQRILEKNLREDESA